MERYVASMNKVGGRRVSVQFFSIFFYFKSILRILKFFCGDQLHPIVGNITYFDVIKEKTLKISNIYG